MDTKTSVQRAFPFSETPALRSEGLSLAQFYAAFALQGLIACREGVRLKLDPKSLAEEAMRLGSAMAIAAEPHR